MGILVVAPFLLCVLTWNEVAAEARAAPSPGGARDARAPARRLRVRDVEHGSAPVPAPAARRGDRVALPAPRRGAGGPARLHRGRVGREPDGRMVRRPVAHRGDAHAPAVQRDDRVHRVLPLGPGLRTHPGARTPPARRRRSRRAGPPADGAARRGQRAPRPRDHRTPRRRDQAAARASTSSRRRRTSRVWAAGSGIWGPGRSRGPTTCTGSTGTSPGRSR